MYCRVADKRLLSRLKHDVIPLSHRFGDLPLSEWKKIRKKYVFKPADGSGSKGVYLGEKISMKKLEELSSDSVAQEYCPPPHGVTDPLSLDVSQTKYDFRVITRDCDVLGVMTRHFSGQVMEMRSDAAGFRLALREKECW